MYQEKGTCMPYIYKKNQYNNFESVQKNELLEKLKPLCAVDRHIK